MGKIKRLTERQKRIFNKNIGLAVAVTENIYANKLSYISKEDLAQMAYIYLAEAVVEYKPKNSTVAFSTYATNRIKYGIMGQLKKELQHNADMFHQKEEAKVSKDRKEVDPVDLLADKSISVDMAAVVSDKAILDLLNAVDSKSDTLKKAGAMFRYYISGHTLKQTGEKFGCSSVNSFKLIDKYKKEAKALAIANDIYPSG